MPTISNSCSREALPEAIQDVVVIGAGVVGCALARGFVDRGLKTAVVEKSTDILDGASKGNSAILHTGFDAPVDSLEQRCIASGYAQYLELAPSLGLPILRTGAFVVAWNAEQRDQLVAIRDKAVANGIANSRLHSASTLLAAVPGISTNALGALEIPDEYVIDPWTTPLAYLHQAIAGGGSLHRRCEVVGGSFSNGVWTVETSRGSVRARLIVNSAGLYGDMVNERLRGATPYTIKPRKGQFVVFDKVAANMTDAIILPVPDKRTKGVVVCPTIFGNVLVGPTAEDQLSRSDASTDQATLEALCQRGTNILPALADAPVTATYAGLRPATGDPEYQIRFHSEDNYIDVGGIRSTGLSAALGIARYVIDEAEGTGHWSTTTQPANNPLPHALPVLAEHGERDWQRPGNGGIVCHCEHVTRREILAALEGPLAATSLSGLKRRTRATMGRCQGFYCSAALCALTKGKLDPPMARSS